MRIFRYPVPEWLPVATGLWFLAACVTVNIYFPAAAAEKAADRIIEDVWGKTPRGQPPPKQQGRLDGAGWQVAFRDGLADLLVPAAQAQQANININTPAINRIKNAMAARFRQLEPYFNSGAVGLTRDGLVAVRDVNAVGLRDRSKVQQLVSAENRDRNELYRQIAVANGHPEWESDIRATFARRWVDNARRGWWYQGPGGGWQQK